MNCSTFSKYLLPVFDFVLHFGDERATHTVFTFLSFSQKTGIFDGCNNDIKFASRELNIFIAFSCFMAPENAKIFQVLQAGVIL
jgi:hypothetical protein